MNSCPCGSNLEYSECCAQIHSGDRSPKTALELMKARYSAFAKNQIEFVDNTHIPGTVDFNKEEAAEWAVSSIWKRLEIVKTEAGEVDDDKGMVEFKAYYDDKKGNQYIHHEIAQFEKKDGDWFYSEGEIPETTPFTRATPKVGRNEPCPCGSGKKFKKCCGA